MPGMVITGTTELQQMSRDLMADGKLGKKIFRKGIRAGANVIKKKVKETYPKKSGAAVRSAKVKALKRKKGRIGVRVSVYAENTKTGYPYTVALEGGAKIQPKKGRVRKKTKLVTVNGRSRRVTDEASSTAYNALAWRIKPRHDVKKAFDSSVRAAESKILGTWVSELEKVSVK